MSTFKTGDNVIFRHPEHSWVMGVVESVSKEGIVCITKDDIRKDTTPNEAITIKKMEDIELFFFGGVFNESPDDLLTLTILHEAVLLRCLYIRYMSDIVYTNIGAIVVALNPFTYSIPRYQDTEMKKYLAAGRSLNATSLPPNLVPHSWTQAHITYYEMVDSVSNQSIIVSGESGAGKTEATKIVLKYLGIISSLSASGEDQRASLNIGEKLVSCSPILECFGNAKTVRNDNSSRFGKFMKVKFNSKHLVVGAETTNYLLEKSRVVSAAKGERLYHSFYLLVRSKGSMTRTLNLESEAQYISLSSGGTMNNSEYNSESDFNDVCHSMEKVGMTHKEITSVWRVTAAVMTLLNVRFLPEEEGCSIDPKTMNYVKKAVRLLEIDEEALIHELLTSTRALPNNQFALKRNDVVSAIDIRDAMCKHLYQGIFSWLIDRCNNLCDVESDGNWIGLLDIFGFEDFKVNSFEQLCINLTNERLQYHYNLNIFKRDLEECKKEGIDVTDIKFPDNTECLNMLTAQGGILPLLDECCWLGGGTDLGFLTKVVDKHEKNPFFKKDPVSRDTFCVRHYAADVTYNVMGWIEKNRDTLKDSIKTIVRGSHDNVIAHCLPAPIPLSEKKKGGKEFTVSGFFRNQLSSLMDLIGSTNPHWIRCIKPHPLKKPRMFHGRETMNQLESSGVLGTIKIRKAGYPVRLPRNIFCHRYRLCSSLQEGNEKELVEDIIKRAQLEIPAQVQLGSTKVFLKSEAHNILEKLRNQHLLQTSMLLQRISRGYLARHKLFLAHLLLHKAEHLRKKLERALKEVWEKEKQFRDSCKSEEEQLWGSLMQLENEKRSVQMAIEVERKERIRKEEEKRRKREEEERRRIEEARRLEELRNKAAICIQRHVRGELVRIKLYRVLLEERRAAVEYERERACEQERVIMRSIDHERVLDEKSWIEWLNTVDHLKRKKQQDEQRLNEKALQKRRILIRELIRKEDKFRLHIEVEENDERIEWMARCQALAKDIKKKKSKGRQRVHQLHTRHVESFQPKQLEVENLAERSAASDARMRDSLVEYALSRARQYEEKPDEKEGIRSTTKNTFSKDYTEEYMFNQVRKKWLREQECMEQGIVSPSTEHDLRPSVMSNPGFKNLVDVDINNNNNTINTINSNNNNQFSAPYRTVEASLKSISPLLQSPSQFTQTAMTERGIRTGTEPSWIIDESEVKKNKKTFDWDSVFRY
ncbi:putative myosin heavy chain [Trypanosoma theileri]|uniref:Putative myosin heavy chain n=1 Tax=Trypanosoma theileri TaxID=67003 RepID=A0A1X0NNV7_9TRYP|nr:putative myosin heavy chain [Trypanosoma theileri]ORC86402.1 putative myosin heavy chain [Trypanosoma theileri]